MLVQIPVFFSLYKVLYVTIEMRHAPFFGWIKDLSAPRSHHLDQPLRPVPWAVPDRCMPFVGGILSIGRRLAVLMGFTMFLQQKLNPHAARSGAGEDLHVPADRLHLHAGAFPGRAW